MKEGKNIEIIHIDDKEYPYKLRKIKNPPQQLYLEGNRKLLQENIISIIGTRQCSKNGEKLTEKFAKELVLQNIVIASGMALRNRHMCT